MADTQVTRKDFNEFCYSCNVDLTGRRVFVFNVPNTGIRIVKCFRCGLHHPPILKRSLRVAVIVGTVLTLLNQGDLLITGQIHYSHMWKIPLTYCVPFAVATYGALASSRNKSSV